MSLDQLILTLATELQLPELSLNANGTCQLVMDDNLAITIEDAPLERSAHLYAKVASTPDTGREDFFAALLEAQLFGREVGEGCAFGYERATGEILLCRKISLGAVDESTFSQILTEFVNWAEHWSTKLSGSEEESTKSELSGDGFSLHEHFIRA